MNQTFTLFLEILGTVAFSASGAILAMEKKMDVLGVVVLGMTTAVGGGIIRDLILGLTPPTAFQKPMYSMVAIAVALICFLKPVRSRLDEDDAIFRLFDSLGLGIFTVIGVETGIVAAGRNMFLAVFVGVVTGVGGGVMRDIFAGNLPSIFVKRFYACASIIGAIVCYVTWPFVGVSTAMLLGTVTVTALRLLAARYKWKLPK